MKRLLAFILFAFLSSSVQGQILAPIAWGPATAASLGFVADGTPCAADNAAGTGTSPFSCGSITVGTPGDLIACQWALDGAGAAYGAISDATNGAYKVAMAPASNDGNVDMAWQGQSYFENAASGTYAISLTFANTDGFVSLACQPWKNARTTGVLDGGSVFQAKDQNTTATNPTSGTAATPASNDLIVGFMTNGCTATPTAGTNFTLISSLSANCEYVETWAQSTATAVNAPFTAATADKYRDQQVGYLPTGATAGVEPTPMLIDMEGLTNATAPTAAAMAASTHGINAVSGDWVCQNVNTMITGSTSGQLHNLLNNIWVSGTSYSGTGSLGFQVNTFAGSPTGANNCNLTIGASSAMTAAFIFETDIPQTETAGNQYSMNQIGTTGLEQCNPFITANGSAISIKAEHHGGGSSASIAIATSTIYEMQLQLVAGVSCTIRIWDMTGTELTGSPIICSSSALGHQCVADFTTGNPNQFDVGITGAELESSGHHIWTDVIRLDPGSTLGFPLTL